MQYDCKPNVSLKLKIVMICKCPLYVQYHAAFKKIIVQYPIVNHYFCIARITRIFIDLFKIKRVPFDIK